MKHKKLLTSILIDGIVLLGIPLLILLLHEIERAATDGPGAGGQAMPGLTIWGILLFMYWVFVIPAYTGLSLLFELIASNSLSQMIMGIKIYDVDKNLANIGKRIIRILSKYAILGLFVLLLIGQAEINLFSILVGILVLGYLIVNLYFIKEKGRTVPDLIAGTIVLK